MKLVYLHSCRHNVFLFFAFSQLCSAVDLVQMLIMCVDMGSTHVGVSVNTHFCVCAYGGKRASSGLIPQESPILRWSFRRAWSSCIRADNLSAPIQSWNHTTVTSIFRWILWTHLRSPDLQSQYFCDCAVSPGPVLLIWDDAWYIAWCNGCSVHQRRNWSSCKRPCEGLYILIL